MSNKALGATIIAFMLAAAAASTFYAATRDIPSAEPAIPQTKLEKMLSVDPATSFTLVVLPDTQRYSKNYPDIFCDQTKWIVENRKDLNIVFVSQLGDIVDSGGKDPEEWRVASSCLGLLDGIVPYGIIPGNHDTEKASNKASGFASYDKHFPVSRYSSYPWYGGSFENYRNNYQIITANGIKFLFLNLEIEPSDKALEWAKTVVEKNTDAYGIVTTHKFLPDEGNERDKDLKFSTDGNTGEQIWDKLVSKNCSIRLVLNGHYNWDDGENRISSKNSCGDRVDQVTQDYQSREIGGNGRLRVYTFTPSKEKISVKTYSPYTDTFEEDNDSEFTLPFKR